jgi:dephospho-CoA kinase
MSEAEARARLSAQLPLKDKLAAADYVIENDRDLDGLTERADDVLDDICEKAGVAPSRYPRRYA